MNPQNLPNEVTQLIIQHLPRETVYQCMFVCKSWIMVAAQLYYRDLSLTGDMISYLQQQQLMMIHDNIEFFTILLLKTQGALVRSLKIHQDHPRKKRFNSKKFLCLMSHMPYLTRIDLTSTRKCIHYFKLLRSVEEDTVYLNRLEEISVSFDDYVYENDGLDVYFAACHKYRQTLTHLYLRRAREDRFTNIRGQWDTFMHSLPDFNSLTHLYMADSSTKVTPLDPIFEACPTLTYFTYKNRSSLNSDAIAKLLSLTHPTDNALSKISDRHNTAVTLSSTGEEPWLAFYRAISLIAGDPQQQKTFYHNDHCRNLKELTLIAPLIDMQSSMHYIV